MSIPSMWTELEELERQGYGRDDDVEVEDERPVRRTAKGPRPKPRRRRVTSRPEDDDWDRGCAEWYRQMRAIRSEYD